MKDKFIFFSGKIINIKEILYLEQIYDITERKKYKIYCYLKGGYIFREEFDTFQEQTERYSEIFEDLKENS